MSSSSFVDRPLCVASLVVMVGRIVLGCPLSGVAPSSPSRYVCMLFVGV